MKVAVLRGGPSGEHEVSLETGRNVLEFLPEDYEGHDIWISKEGEWHYRGTPVDPLEAIRKFDIFFNALHGKYGEDGQVQKILERTAASYTGPRPMPAALSMNKRLSKEIFRKEGILTPHHKILKHSESLDREILEFFRTGVMPAVVKPVDGGSSLGVAIARNFDELHEAVRRAFDHSDEVMLEEYIEGREVTCGVLENFRGEDVYAFPPIEIVCRHSHFFNYDEKYKHEFQHLCPAPLSESEKKEVLELARIVHGALGLRHYSRSDFIIHPRRGIYVLEVNSLPGMTSHSLLPRAADSVGLNFSNLIGHIVRMA